MDNKKRRAITAVYVNVFMIAFAISSNVFSTVLPRITEQYALTPTQTSNISTMTSIGMLLANLFTAFFVDKLDKNRVLGVCMLFTAVFQFLIGSVPPFVGLLACYVGLGMVSNIVNNGCSSYLSDLYDEERSRYISILHAFFGLGSMAGPQFVNLIIKMGLAWNQVYRTISFIFGISAIAYAITMVFIKKPEPLVGKVEKGVKKQIPWKELFGSFNMQILCIVSFLYAGYNMLSTYLPTYLNDHNPQMYPLARTANIMTAMSAGVIVSRLANGFVSRYITARNHIMYVALIGPFVLASGFLVDNSWYWMVVCFLMGALCGAIYTAQFVMACEYFPHFSATATAMTGFCSSIGSIMWNKVTGYVATQFGYGTAMVIPVVVLLVVFALLLATKKKAERIDKQQKA